MIPFNFSDHNSFSSLVKWKVTLSSLNNVNCIWYWIGKSETRETTKQISVCFFPCKINGLELLLLVSLDSQFSRSYRFKEAALFVEHECCSRFRFTNGENNARGY